MGPTGGAATGGPAIIVAGCCALTAFSQPIRETGKKRRFDCSSRSYEPNRASNLSNMQVAKYHLLYQLTPLFKKRQLVAL